MPSWGYDGTVTESIWAPRLSQAVGYRHGVYSPADLVATGVAGARTLQVSTGWCFGWGVVDQFQLTTTINLAANSSGTVRYDTVVVRRNWSTNVTSMFAIQGGSSPVIASGLSNTPGTQADQPLWIIPVANGATSLVGVTPIDCRWYPSLTAISGRQPESPGSNPLLWVSLAREISLWTGSAWDSITDPPWLTMSHGPNMANSTMKARVVGGMIQFQGSAENRLAPGYTTATNFDTNSLTSVGLLPTEFPGLDRQAPVTFTNTASNGILVVNTDGTVQARALTGVGSAAASKSISLDGVAVPL